MTKTITIGVDYYNNLRKENMDLKNRVIILQEENRLLTKVRDELHKKLLETVKK